MCGKTRAPNSQAPKVVLHWHQVFLKAIGSKEQGAPRPLMKRTDRLTSELARLPRSLDGHLLPMSKIVSVWWPIMAFAGLGMDYVIANMFLIPIGILNRAPVGVGYYLWYDAPSIRRLATALTPT